MSHLLNGAIEQVKSKLRATPAHLRNAHWQMAQRNIVSAATYRIRDPQYAEQCASQALFHVQFIPCEVA